MIKIKAMSWLALLSAAGLPSEEAASSSQSSGVQIPQSGMPQESAELEGRRIVFYSILTGDLIHIPKNIRNIFNEKFDEMKNNIQQANSETEPSLRLDFGDMFATFTFDVGNLQNSSEDIKVKTYMRSKYQILEDLYHRALYGYNPTQRDSGNKIFIILNITEREGKYYAAVPSNGSNDSISFEIGEDPYLENVKTLRISSFAMLLDPKLDGHMSAKCIDPNDPKDAGFMQIMNKEGLLLDYFFKHIYFAHPTKNVPPDLEGPMKQIIDGLNKCFKGDVTDLLAMSNFSGYQMTKCVNPYHHQTGYFNLVEFTNTLNGNIIEFGICANVSRKPIILITTKENIIVQSQQELSAAVSKRVNLEQLSRVVIQKRSNDEHTIFSFNLVQSGQFSSTQFSIYCKNIHCNDLPEIRGYELSDLADEGSIVTSNNKLLINGTLYPMREE